MNNRAFACVQNNFDSEKIYVFHEYALSSKSNNADHLHMHLNPDYKQTPKLRTMGG